MMLGDQLSHEHTVLATRAVMEREQIRVGRQHLQYYRESLFTV